jgi:hypothetical protein
MAWEWVGPTVTGVVALAGIASTFATASRGRAQAERLASQSYDRSDAASREARRQERLATAYVEVLDIAEQVGQWAQSLSPVMDTIPPQPLPPLPPLPSQSRARALILAFGTDEALEALESWRTAVREVEHAHHSLQLAQRTLERHGVTGIDEASIWLNLGTVLKPGEVEARRHLSDVIAADLAARNARQAVEPPPT